MSKYSEKNFLKSFGYALHGLRIALKSQKNFKRQIIIGFLSVMAGFYMHFSVIEFCILLMLIAMVLICELFNSVIEFMLDSVFKNKYSKLVGMSKDMAAGAVCLASTFTLITGVILFSSKIVPIVQGLI